VAALEAGDVECNEIGVARCKFRRPHLVICTRRIGVLPNILYSERVTDYPGTNLLAKQTVQPIVVKGQCALREDRIAGFLKVVEYLVIETRVVMIWTAKHHNADAIFLF
jgi:hypothetical protein